MYSCAPDSTLAMTTTVACPSLYSADIQSLDVEYVTPELAVLRFLDMVFTKAPLLLKEKQGRAMLRWPCSSCKKASGADTTLKASAMKSDRPATSLCSPLLSPPLRHRGRSDLMHAVEGKEGRCLLQKNE